MAYIKMTTDELIEVLKQHSGKQVVIDDPDCCLVVSNQISVSLVGHVDHGECVMISGLFRTLK